MKLSVLTIPGKDHGLWDNDQDKFIKLGTEDECYDEKHRLEFAEQQEENKVWKDKVYSDRFNLLTGAGLSEGYARNAVDVMFRRFAKI